MTALNRVECTQVAKVLTQNKGYHHHHSCEYRLGRWGEYALKSSKGVTSSASSMSQMIRQSARSWRNGWRGGGSKTLFHASIDTIIIVVEIKLSQMKKQIKKTWRWLSTVFCELANASRGRYTARDGRHLQRTGR